MRVEMLTVGPFQSNCFVASCKETNEAIVIDACDEADLILGYVKDNGLDVKMIVNTHAHIDHVTALADVKERLQVPVLMHRRENVIYEALPQQSMMFGLASPRLVEIDRYVQAGDTVTFGTCTGKVIETPGHSPGGITIFFEATQPPHAFVGDVLFMGSIGRTDLFGADHRHMIHTLRDVIMTLPDDTVVCPGHGPVTTIGHEKRSNPFLLELQ